MRVNFIVFLHGEDVTQFLYRYHGLRGFLAKRILKHAYLIIVNSNYTMMKALELVSDISPKLVKINPGIDFKYFRTPINPFYLNKKYNLNGNRVILSVGRLVPQKGYQNVILVFKKLLSSFPNIVYFIVGEGPLKEYLINQINRLGLIGKVYLPGYIDHFHLVSFYKIADIFIHPNYECRKTGLTEGYGMVIKEAMVMGKAVIAGNYGGVKELIKNGENGLLIDSRDETQIESALRLLLENEKLRKSLGLKAQASIGDDSDWQKVSFSFQEAIFNWRKRC